MPESSTIQDLKEQLAKADAEIAQLRADRAAAVTAALRESEERYRAFFEFIDEGVVTLDVILDPNGTVLDATYAETNAAFDRMTGLTVDIAGKRMSEVIANPEPFWFDTFGRVIDSGKPSRFEHRVHDPQDRWFDVFANRVGGDGSARIVLVYNDITERKRAELALRVSEERQAFGRKLGDALRPPPDPTAVQEEACRLPAEHPKTDRANHVEIDEDAGSAAVERGRAEAALRANEERYRTLFQSMDEGYCIIEMIYDEQGTAIDYRFLEANAALERHSGLKSAVGKRMLEMVPDHERHWFEIYDRVAQTGESVRFEQVGKHLPNSSIYELYAFRIGAPELRQVAVLFIDIGPRRRAEQALRESEERQAFLLELSDALRPLTDPLEITANTTRILGEYMQADRTFIAMMEPDGVNLDVHHEYLRPGASSVIGHHNFDQFGAFVSPRLVEGHIMAVEDVSTLALTAAEREHYASVGIAAYLLVPLVRDGRFAACFTCNHQTPRPWTEADKNVVRQAADRTWAALERARAETALRESEERFAQFVGASSGGIWIRDAGTLALEYASPAIRIIYGVEAGEFGAEIENWAAMIVPDDRAVALKHIERARQGEASVHEFRIQRPSDRAFRWIRDTGFPLQMNGHVQRIGGIAEDITDAKLALEHQGVLLAELQHRVRNIMALIRSITARTGERAASVQDYTELMLGRLLAVARVQALLTRAANVSVGISSVVHDEVSVQAQHERQYVIAGPDIQLSPKAAEVLTLAVHELATNAVKHGALSGPNGRVTVTWSTFEKRGGTWLAFDWVEEGAPQRAPSAMDGPKRRGFGSELIEGRVPYELKGKGTIAIEPGGARCHLEFPLQSGASILETGAPQRATVFGGALDMTGEPDLGGHRILVVEDDYYLAADAARALRGAGAQVMGPCGSEADARAELDEQRPDAVILDINLGQGATFKLAEHLKDTGIPFVFTTGYDQMAIPAEFDGVERLEKPFQLRQVVGAASRLVGRAL